MSRLKAIGVLILVTTLLLLSMGIVFADDSPTLREHLNTGGDGNSQLIYGLSWSAMQFTTDAMGHSASHIKLSLKRVLNPGTITVSLREADAAHKPTGLDLASGTFDGDVLLTSYGFVEIDIDDVNLEGDTEYTIVVRAMAGDASNYVLWQTDAGGGLADAVSLHSTDMGSSWTDDDPVDLLFEVWGYDIVKVNGVGIFSGYLEDNDLLIVVDMNTTYPPYYPTEDSSSYFDLRFYSDNGSVVYASTPVVDWDRRAGSLYLSADSAAPITWGDNYTVKIIGTFDPTNVIASYELTTGDWYGSDLTYLDRWVIREAHIMEEYYSLTFVTSVGGGVEVLNAAGGAEMVKGISGLNVIRPNIFQTVVETPVYEEEEFTDAYEGATTWGTEVGVGVAATMTSLGAIVGMDGKGVLQFLIIGGMILLAFLTRSVFFGLMLSMPIGLWGVSMRVIPWAIVGVMGGIMIWILVYKLWWSKS